MWRIWVLWMAATTWTMAGEVILYEHSGFGGRSEVFDRDDPNLNDNFIGNDQLSSIRVPRGCQVILYEHRDYEGRSILVQGDIANLSRTPFGNDCASSIAIQWDHDDRWEDLGGITLYSGDYWTGRNETFERDVADLKMSMIGNDQVNSVRVAWGYELILYEHKNFQGSWLSFTEDDPSLRNNDFANRASSFQIRRIETERRRDRREQWRAQREGYYDDRDGGGYDTPRERKEERKERRDDHKERKKERKEERREEYHEERRDERWEGVVLYRKTHYKGEEMALIDDMPDLKGSDIGNDDLSSLYVPPGFRVILYAHRNFEGPSEVFEDSDPDLSDNRIGNDSASSIRVERINRRRR